MEVIVEQLFGGSLSLRARSRVNAIRTPMMPQKQELLLEYTKDDGETESTCTEDDLSWSYAGSSSSLQSHMAVSFASPLVTAVYERPKTLVVDKSKLYYRESDYREFRRDFVMQKRDNCKVTIHEDVVTEVWEFVPPQDTSVLYYSENDLQDFLEDFVQSLNPSL